MQRIFVSYCSLNRTLATRWVIALRREGYNAWQDLDGVRLLASVERAVLDALRPSAAVVVILTSQSLSRPWVAAEIQCARTHRIPVIVANCDGCAVPGSCAGVPVVDLWRDEEQGFSTLLRTLRFRLRALSGDPAS